MTPAPDEAPAATGLPPGFDLLWGLRERPTKGPKPGLTLEGIVDQAVAIADAEGIAALSMARVAKELGFTAMSLYRYLASKDELVMLMIDRASGTPPVLPAAWRDALRGWSLAQMDIFTAHPWFVQIPMASPPAGPNGLAWVESGMAALEPTGLSAPEKFGVIGLVASYALSEARLASEARPTPGPDAAEPITYEQTLARVADPDRHPTIIALLAEIGEVPTTDEDVFGWGLERILDGIEALIADRKAG